jgi:hypothetical protein
LRLQVSDFFRARGNRGYVEQRDAQQQARCRAREGLTKAQGSATVDDSCRKCTRVLCSLEESSRA